jgi:hypothetical protein
VILASDFGAGKKLKQNIERIKLNEIMNFFVN